MTSERLQNIAVNCVTQFMNKQASLSEAIAKEASEIGLNSEQTKRVIEASNTIAYLRQLEKSADRTFEFKQADYTDVMGHMCLPDAQPETLVKTASVVTPATVQVSKEVVNTSTLQEKMAMLAKAHFTAKSTLEKIAYDKIDLHLRISKASSILNKDLHGYEKLAEVAKGEDLLKVVKLCGIEKTAADNVVFTNKDLTVASEVYSLLKEAEALLLKEAEIRGFVDKSGEVLFKQTANVEKLAGFGTIVGGAIGTVVGGGLRALGTLANRGAVAAGRKASGALKETGAFSTVARERGFKTTTDAVKSYDKMKVTNPKQLDVRFRGTHPSMLNRITLGGTLSAAGGLGMDHTKNVNEL